MASAIQKIILSSSRDIPFNKLVLSQANVRRVKSGVSIEELAESIARCGLIQSLHVRPVLDAEGQETSMFEVPAGGRRYRALELLAKQKRLAKTAPVPCVVSDAASGILIDEISLVENIDRAPLLGYASQLSCWVRRAVMVLGDIHGTYRGRQTDVRVKRSRSEARTTLEAAAAPQAF
jgi:ParB-like chromosome segregation protein Spo0J